MKTIGRVRSQQGAPSTCNLTYWEVSQQTYVQTLMASLGVVRWQNSALQGGGEGGWKQEIGCSVEGEGGMGKRFLTAHSSYFRHYIPHNTFLPRTYHYFHISQPAKNCQKNRYFVEQIHWVPLSIIKNSLGPKDPKLNTFCTSIISLTHL